MHLDKICDTYIHTVVNRFVIVVVGCLQKGLWVVVILLVKR